MKICLFPGSFDPFTSGHADIVKKACAIFDKVIIGVLDNSEKKYMFDKTQRLEIVNAFLSESGLANAEAISFSGLTSDAAKEAGARYIVKGLRNEADFTYEYEMASIIRSFDPSLQTVFIPSDKDNDHISSTYVRELIKYGKFDMPAFAKGTSEKIKDFTK